MLQVNEETVRRWIREEKLPAIRKVGRTGSSIKLEDVIEYANLKPHRYHESMMHWLKENNIDFALQKTPQNVNTESKPYLKDRGGALYALVASAVLTLPKIVLPSPQEDKNSARHTIEPTAHQDCTVYSKETGQQEISEMHIKEKIFEEKQRLIRLEQEMAKINAEISVCKGEIEYYTLLLEKM